MNTAKHHLDNIRKRYLHKKNKAAGPAESCKKCSNRAWYKDDTYEGWYCFICGARGHFEGQKFVQY